MIDKIYQTMIFLLKFFLAKKSLKKDNFMCKQLNMGKLDKKKFNKNNHVLNNLE